MAHGCELNAEGLGYFVSGAVGTAAGMAGACVNPLLGAMLGGFVTGAGNNWVQTGSFNVENMLKAGIMGAAIGGFSYGLGSYFDGLTNSWFTGISNTTLRITASHATSGILTGATIGAITYNEDSKGSFWENVASGAGVGFISGASSGYIKGKQQTHLSKYNTTNLWNKEVKWPENGGAADNWSSNTLNPGDVIDRYGKTSGHYASPEGTPFEQRSLPATSKDLPYDAYKVLTPLNVKSSVIAPAFGQPGGGIQYLFEKPLQYYIDNGYLKLK